MVCMTLEENVFSAHSTLHNSENIKQVGLVTEITSSTISTLAIPIHYF